MKTFQEFLEQAGSPSMSARQNMYNTLAVERSKQRIKQSFWRQREATRNKRRQNAEMHNDLERTGGLP